MNCIDLGLWCEVFQNSFLVYMIIYVVFIYDYILDVYHDDIKILYLFHKSSGGDFYISEYSGISL